MSAAAVDSPAHRANSLSGTFWLGQMDLRPLALFRIAFGLFIAFDLCDLLPIATTFFSDAGVMPRASLLTQMARANRFTISDVMGPPETVYLFWALAMLACLFVVFGYRTRIAVVVLYLFVAGFNERLPELFDGSDSVIRLTLFWLCFCPSNHRYSVDALLAKLRGAPLSPTGSALPVRVVQAQVAWVYFCSALHKTGGNTWHDGTALHYVLHLNHVFARPWAAALADYPFPMAVGTYFTLVLEFGFTFLVFSPVLNKWTKALALAMGTALHGGIAFSVNVGLFSYLMPVTYLIFFEPAWTDWLIDRLKRFCGAGTTAVLYDGACAVCRRGAMALEDMDRFGNLELRDATKEELPKGVTRKQVEQGLFAIPPGGAPVTGYPALLAMGRRLPGAFVPAFLGGLPGLAALGKWLDERASAYLHARAKQLNLPVDPPARTEPTFFSEGLRRTGRDLVYVGMVGLFVSAAWYAAPQPGRRELPLVAEQTVQWFSLWNVWDMFSPEPLRTDYHLRAPAEFSDGSQEDLFSGAEMDRGEYRGFWFSRWWKYLENVTQGQKVIQEEWARWQCKSHNWHGEKRALYKFKLLRDNQIIPPIGQPWPPVQTGEIVTWRCFDKPEDKPKPPGAALEAGTETAHPTPPLQPPLLATPASQALP